MTALILIVAGAISGGETPLPITAPPKWPAPQFGVAVVNEKGGIEVRYAESAPVWQSRMRSKTSQVREGDQWKSVGERTAYKIRLHETKQATETRDAGQFRVFRNGEELDHKTYTELLKQPRRVVFLESTQFAVNWPNEFYLDLLAKDALVVLLDLLKTPETEVDPAKVEKRPPPAADTPGAKPPAAPLPRRVGPDGLYWRESLYVLPEWSNERREAPHALAPRPDPDLGVLYVVLRNRPDVVREGWGGPQLRPLPFGGELTWFGHFTSHGLSGAERISFDDQYFLSVVDAQSKPRLVLTEDPDKASLWRITGGRSWSDKGDPKGEGTGDAHHSTGYVQLADAQLWLSLSPEPIFQTRREWRRGERKETIECRLLSVSAKKECLFQYDRWWSPRN